MWSLERARPRTCEPLLNHPCTPRKKLALWFYAVLFIDCLIRFVNIFPKTFVSKVMKYIGFKFVICMTLLYVGSKYQHQQKVSQCSVTKTYSTGCHWNLSHTTELFSLSVPSCHTVLPSTTLGSCCEPVCCAPSWLCMWSVLLLHNSLTACQHWTVCLQMLQKWKRMFTLGFH